jgi:hypothetical protein
MSNLISFIDFMERMRLHHYIMDINMDINIDNDILERSIQEQGEIIKPCSGSFVNDLEKIIITNREVDNELCCAICQDKFKLGDKVIKLPCNDPHFFHYNSDPELCNGILPWLKNNNTCPICREEFPLEPTDTSNTLNDSNNDVEVSTAVEQILETIVRNIDSSPRYNPLPNMEVPPNFREIPPPVNPRRTIILPISFDNHIPFNMNNSYDSQEPYDPDLQEAIRLSLEE